MRENGLLNFANKIYKSDIKRSKSYILITALTMAFIFNLINISYNDIYAKSNQIYRLAPNYDYPIQLIQINILSYQKVNLYNWNITLLLIVVIITPIIIVTIYSRKINEKRVRENLYRNEELIKIVK